VGTEKTLRFRPAVVVCVGEQGRAVGAQLATLLSEWADADDPRRAGVALLEVDQRRGASAAGKAGDVASGLAGGWMDARLDAEGFFGGPRQAGDVPLRRLIVESLRGREADVDDPGRVGVLDDRVVWRIEEAGYVVPRAMVVVWIVAAASSPLLKPVAEEVRRGLASERVDNWLLLALPNVYPRDPEQHAAQAQECASQPWNDLLVSYNGSAPIATYAYVFETQSERGTFWEHEDDVAVATAEAVFVLTASGITTTREYEDMLRRSTHHMVRDPYERMSGIGTSRLYFPRAHAEQYSANQLGAELMRLWAQTEESELAPTATGALRSSARAVVVELRSQIADDSSVVRGGRPSPRISAQAVSRARPLPRRSADAGLIFRHFTQPELRRVADGRRDLPSRLAEQREKAEEGFAIWAQSIRPEWERTERALDRKLTTKAEELVLEGVGGVSRARTYLDEVHHLLIAERERLARQREERAIAYGRFLDAMDLAAEGPWLTDAQAAPAMAASARVVPQSAPRPGMPAYAVPAPVAPGALPSGVPGSSSYPSYPSYPSYGPGPSYQSYPSYPSSSYPSYPPAAQPAPELAPGLAPGIATTAGPQFTPTGFTPAPEARGRWPIVYTSAPLGPGGWPARPAAVGTMSDPYAPTPRYGPISGAAVPVAPDPISDPSLPSLPSFPSVSGPISEPSLPTMQPMQRLPSSPTGPVGPSGASSASGGAGAATGGPMPLDPPTGPIGAGGRQGMQTLPPSTWSAPLAQQPPYQGAISQGVPPASPPSFPSYPSLPSYLAPSAPVAPGAPFAPPVTGAPMVVALEPPAHEERVIAKLVSRVRFYEARRPRPATLIGTGLVALTPLVFLGQALAPAAWLDRPFGLLELTAALAALVAVVAMAYAGMRARQVGRAADDLRTIYGRVFADRCECYEDARREAIVTGLLARVRRVVDRLSQWETFATTMAETMEREAATVERALFDGAIGRRNVLVANRKRLNPQSYRLADLEVDVSTRRRRHPVDGYEWHSDLTAMLPRLSKRLMGGVSFLEADPSQVVTPVRAFCADVVRPYLSGEIADLSAAFELLPPDEATAYLDAMMERSAILYRPVDPPRGALAFVAARDEHQEYMSGKKQPTEPILLRISDRGWLGVLRLVPGGSLPTFGMPDAAQRKPVLNQPTWSSGPSGSIYPPSSSAFSQPLSQQLSQPPSQPPSQPLNRPPDPVRAPNTRPRFAGSASTNLSQPLGLSQSTDAWQGAASWEPRQPTNSTWLLDGTGQPNSTRLQS